MFKGKRILVVVAHPDDELLGCGATIHRLIKLGCAIKVIILGEGLTARSDERNTTALKEELSQHRNNILAAQKVLGYQELSIHQLPDNRFDSVDMLDIVKIIEKEKQQFTPDYIFTHHGGDLNIDHRLTFQAVLTATRPLQGEVVKGIFTFETPSATEWSFNLDADGFRPNLFIKVDAEDLKAKQEALKKYSFEIRDYPHPHSTHALEVYARSHGTRVGHDFAEAFQIIRYIT